MTKHKPIEAGDKFGRLTAVCMDSIRKTSYGQPKKYWKFKCDCGNDVIALAYNVKSGHTTSCGCACIDATKKASTIHGATCGQIHGKKLHPLFVVWSKMKDRCLRSNNPSYKYYGGRGIKISESWMQFVNFKNDMDLGYAHGLSLDRIDNNGDYCIDNCRWATHKEQCRNKRNNVVLEFNGERKTLIEWSESTGIPYHRLQGRVGLGWNTQRLLTTP